ncbi:hypothetical protein E4U14_001415, partial [Claviceps sp. LM454 group G7]
MSGHPPASQPGGEIDISSAVQSLPSRPLIPAALQPLSRGEIDVGLATSFSSEVLLPPLRPPIPAALQPLSRGEID